LSRGSDGFGTVFRSSSRSRPSTKRAASSKLILRPIISASTSFGSPLRPCPFPFRHLGSKAQGGAREKEERHNHAGGCNARVDASGRASLGLTGIRLQMKDFMQPSKRRRLRLAEFDGARRGPQLFARFRFGALRPA
jgi:hypothetical protein